MRICCIDDDNNFLQLIKQYTVDYAFKKDIEIKTKFYEIVPDSVPDNIDVFFLDIVMNDETTFSFVEKIRQKHKDTPIIFFTNHDSYVFKSVKYNIFDFIRKSNISNEFEPMMNNLLDHYYEMPSYIIIKSNGLLEKVKISDIIYIEAFSHTTIIHLTNKIIEQNKGAKEILNINHFCRIHRSYYVNLNHLKTISKNNVTLMNGRILPVGKTYYQNIKKEFLQHFCH